MSDKVVQIRKPGLLNADGSNMEVEIPWLMLRDEGGVLTLASPEETEGVRNSYCFKALDGKMALSHLITFQVTDVDEVGVTGLKPADVLEIVADHLRSTLNRDMKNKDPKRQHSTALLAVEEAILWLDDLARKTELKKALRK